jgi:hypothetical protein
VTLREDGVRRELDVEAADLAAGLVELAAAYGQDLRSSK